MTEEEVQEIWVRVTQNVADDPSVGRVVGAHLGLAVPRGVTAGTLYLAVPLEFTQKLLEGRLRPAILTALVNDPSSEPITNFLVVVDEDAHPTLDPEPMVVSESDIEEVERVAPRASTFDMVRPVAEQPRHASGEQTDSRLNEKYRFDSFVIGQSNRFAHAAAVAVAEAPARAYNPLFIYGESGLGKTHLLHAIGHYAKELYGDIRVRYVSSEDFTNDFINSIANNQGAAFHSRYRSVDILLIDDIQFLQDKIETQEAFFHTFNTLHDHNKQVVITSDVHPKKLSGFENRMRSRFEMGLTTDIQVPDLETRIAILRKKAEREGLQIDYSILEFIASKFSSNIRELEGTLIRVTAYASLNQQQIDMQLVQTVLKDLITLEADNEVNPADIISCTADYFDLSIDELYGPSRAQQIASARQIAMYLCRELTPLSLPKIGALFGGRDHTTVMYAHKKVTQNIKERRSLFNQVTELTTRVKHLSS